MNSNEDLRQLRLQYKEMFIDPQAAREFTNTHIVPGNNSGCVAKNLGATRWACSSSCCWA
jgi:hypothetical protein